MQPHAGAADGVRQCCPAVAGSEARAGGCLGADQHHQQGGLEALLVSTAALLQAALCLAEGQPLLALAL